MQFLILLLFLEILKIPLLVLEQEEILRRNTEIRAIWTTIDFTQSFVIKVLSFTVILFS